MPKQEIEGWFPNIAREGYEITSPETPEYNCIAWAGNDITQKWDPAAIDGRFWPTGLRRDKKLETFIKLYVICGYTIPTENQDAELGFEKVAIFWIKNVSTLENEVVHAARQTPSGKWTSKLGDFEDIEHNTLAALEGSWYGAVAKILMRPVVAASLTANRIQIIQILRRRSIKRNS